MIRRSFAATWLLAAGAVLALTSTAWSGTAGAWDGVALWAWAAGFAAAGGLGALAAGVGRGRLPLVAAAVGAALTLAATGLWLREWWVLAHHTDVGWWTFSTLTATSDAVQAPPAVSHGLTTAGYVAGALLLVALTAALGTLSRVAPRRQSPSA